MYAIGELSRETGVKVPTIRYYEQVGLISAPERSEGNQRRYGKAELSRLRFIKHSRDLGLPLEAVRELLALSTAPRDSCETIDEVAEQHLRQVRDRILKLQAMEQELERITSGCGRGSRVSDCYVMRSLANHSLCERDH